MAEVFLDASFAIALASPPDIHHSRAVEISSWIERDGSRIVTTRAVMIEIGNALSKRRFRSAAARLLVALETDPSVEILPLSEELYGRAFALFRDREDKDWGLSDCISFQVMKERRLKEALSADEHFRQAGFTPLLLV